MTEVQHWTTQVDRLIKLGFHNELDKEEKQYRAEMPSFEPQPVEFRGRFRWPLLIEPRVSLIKQIALHGVKPEGIIQESDLTRLSLRELQKTNIPSGPYQAWVSYGKSDRSINEFSKDERGFTAIEGLALLREEPRLFRVKVIRAKPKSYLTDIISGRKIGLVSVEQTICADSFWYGNMVVTIYRCRYQSMGEQLMIGKRLWDVNTKNDYSILPTVGITSGKITS